MHLQVSVLGGAAKSPGSPPADDESGAMSPITLDPVSAAPVSAAEAPVLSAAAAPEEHLAAAAAPDLAALAPVAWPTGSQSVGVRHRL